LAGDSPISGGGKVAVRGPGGVAGTYPADQPLPPGWRHETQAEHQDRVLEKKHGNSPVTAFFEGAGDGLLLGGYSALAPHLGVDKENIRERRERNWSATPGQITGAVLPALLTGGTGAVATAARLTPAGLAARAGTATTAAVGRGGGGTILNRAAATAAGGIVEGGAFGAGEGLSRVALSDDPLTATALMGEIGSSALFGGALGGAIGGGGKILAESYRHGKRATAEAVERLARKADDVVPTPTAAAPTPVATPARPTAPTTAPAPPAPTPAAQKAVKAATQHLDEAAAVVKKSSKEAAEEIKRITQSARDDIRELDKQARMAAGRARKAAPSDELTAALAKLDEARVGAQQYFPWEHVEVVKLGKRGLPSKAAPKKEFSLSLTDERLFEVGQNPAAVAAIRQHRQATVDVLRALDPGKEYSLVGGLAGDSFDGIGKAVRKVDAPTPSALTDIAAGQEVVERVAGQGDQALASATEQVAERAQSAGLKISKTDILAAANALGVPIEDVPVVGSPLDMALKAHIALRMAGQAGLTKASGGLVKMAEHAAESALGSGVVSGLKAALGGGLGGTAGKVQGIAGSYSRRVADGIDAFIKGRGGKAAKAAAIPAAVKALGIVSYDGDGQRQKQSPSEALKSRRSELARAMSNPEATRRDIHERLSGIRAVDMKLGDQMESLAMRRLEFLAARMPKNPGLGPSIGKGSLDRYQPSDAELSKFARYVAAAEDPGRVIDELKAGRLTTESVEVLREVYPEMYQDVQRHIIERVTEMQTALSYPQRLQLGILFAVPVDSILRPEMVAALQSSYNQEPDTQGGMSGAPANLGSVKKPEPTRAQRIAER
jgi:hypothetical protein